MGWIPAQLQGALATAALGLVAALVREIYRQRSKQRDQTVEATQQEADTNEERITELQSEVHRVEDEMVDGQERLRERIDRRVSALRSDVNEKFVSRSEFQQLESHIDTRFDDMKGRLQGIESSIRELAKSITDAMTTSN